MDKTQKIEIAQGDDYDELSNDIQGLIAAHRFTHEIQQINYFGMDDLDSAPCTAFILFKPLKRGE